MYLRSLLHFALCKAAELQLVDYIVFMELLSPATMPSHQRK